MPRGAAQEIATATTTKDKKTKKKKKERIFLHDDGLFCWLEMILILLFALSLGYCLHIYSLGRCQQFLDFRGFFFKIEHFISENTNIFFYSN